MLYIWLIFFKNYSSRSGRDRDETEYDWSKRDETVPKFFIRDETETRQVPKFCTRPRRDRESQTKTRPRLSSITDQYMSEDSCLNWYRYRHENSCSEFLNLVDIMPIPIPIQDILRLAFINTDTCPKILVGTNTNPCQKTHGNTYTNTILKLSMRLSQIRERKDSAQFSTSLLS